MMADPNLVDGLRRKYISLSPLLNERQRRIWAAAEAREIGWGGVTAVAVATGLSQTTIGVGLRDLQDPRSEPPVDPPASEFGGRAVVGGRPQLMTSPSWPTWRPWSIR